MARQVFASMLAFLLLTCTMVHAQTIKDRDDGGKEISVEITPEAKAIKAKLTELQKSKPNDWVQLTEDALSIMDLGNSRYWTMQGAIDVLNASARGKDGVVDFQNPAANRAMKFMGMVWGEPLSVDLLAEIEAAEKLKLRCGFQKKWADFWSSSGLTLDIEIAVYRKKEKILLHPSKFTVRPGDKPEEKFEQSLDLKSKDGKPFALTEGDSIEISIRCTSLNKAGKPASEQIQRLIRWQYNGPKKPATRLLPNGVEPSKETVELRDAIQALKDAQ